MAVGQVVDIRSYKKRRSDEEMIWVPGGDIWVPDRDHPRDLARARLVRVSGFWMDRYPVTNERFSAFVDATGYVTDAERHVEQHSHRPLDPRSAGSFVFVPPHRPSAPIDMRDWWVHMRSAQWQRPHGPHSDIDELDRHPVVHVTYRDAQAFARWAGKALPSETQWEYAAFSGFPQWAVPSTKTSDDVGYPVNRLARSLLRGMFDKDVHCATSAVGGSVANNHGLHDMIGNVWEWTSDDYVGVDAHVRLRCRGIPFDASREASGDFKVLKGGSYICALGCLQCRHPEARMPQRTNVSASDVGFRCVLPAHNSCST